MRNQPVSHTTTILSFQQINHASVLSRGKSHGGNLVEIMPGDVKVQQGKGPIQETLISLGHDLVFHIIIWCHLFLFSAAAGWVDCRSTMTTASAPNPSANQPGFPLLDSFAKCCWVT
jgi:hypothetical protein